MLDESYTIYSIDQHNTIMKILIFVSVLTLASGSKIQTRELQYGFCEGSYEPFSIDEFVLEPYPLVVQSGATIRLVIGITLNLPIPVGSTTDLKIVKTGLFDIPMPCISIGDFVFGSWWVEN
jgi:hypothetical protein